MRESLVSSVVSILAGESVSKPINASYGQDDELPIGAPSQVHLPKPGEAMKAVMSRLSELRAEDQAELNAKAEELKKEIATEKEVAASGDFNLKAELAAGTSREELSQKRAAAEIAYEVIRIREDELEQVQEQIQRVAKAWSSKTSSVTASIERLEGTYMSYLQAFCGGDRQSIRHNPDRQTRALKAVISTNANLRSVLKDDALVDSVMAEITTFAVPANYIDLLWGFITDRDKKEQFSDEKPIICKESN